MTVASLVLSVVQPLSADPITKAPELIGQPPDWINTDSQALHLYGDGGILTPGADGHVHHIVLIDFWEYTCVNCIRTLPFVKAWDAEYRDDGLVIIGIHSPEFAFAHDESNVKAAVTRFGIQYPVVNDDSYKNWNAWQNDEWPREILIDSTGNVVEDHRGEGGYAATEAKIRTLLKQINNGALTPTTITTHIEQPYTDRTEETYCGYRRGGGNYVNSGGIATNSVDEYVGPEAVDYRDGGIALSGTWKVTPEALEHVGTRWSDYITLEYHGPDCNAVIKPELGLPCKVLVTQDGQPVRKADAGDDIRYDSSGLSYINVDQPRMYSLTEPTDQGQHILKLQPLTGGFGLYSFAF